MAHLRVKCLFLGGEGGSFGHRKLNESGITPGKTGAEVGHEVTAEQE